MKDYFSKKFQKTKFHFDNLRQKMIVRVWNLGSRLDPKQIRGERKKRKGYFQK